MCGEKADLLPGTFQTHQQGGWQGRPIPLPYLLKLGVYIALQDELHPMAGSQAFDTIDDPCTVLFRRRQFPVELPAVFFVHTRDAYHTPHLLLACHMTQQHREELADIEP